MKGSMAKGLTAVLCFGLLLGVPMAPLGAAEPVAKDSIHWLVPDYPPGYIARGPRAGQGQGDQILDWFRRALPEYRHSVRRESLARTMSILSSGEDNVCIPGFPDFANNRDTMIAGNAIGVVPPLRVITLRDNLPRLAVSDERLSLATTLDNRDLTLAVVAGRDYLDLDKLIREHQDKANLLTVSPGDMVGSLFGMLFSGRVDYLVEHGFMLPYVRSVNAERGGELVMLRLEEGRESVRLYPLCRRNDWGRAMIAELNRITATPDFRHMMAETFRAILPQQEKAEYGQLLDEVIARHP